MSLPDFGKAIRFFQFGYRAYRPRFTELKYDRLARRNRLFRGPCSIVNETLGLRSDLTALISTGTGLLLMRDGKLYKIFDSIGNMFGMTIIADRVYLLHVIQSEGNYKHSEETYRRSEIYSVALADVLSIQPGQHLEMRRELSETRVLYAYCNAYDGRLYAVDYLGRLSVFGVDADGRLDHEGARHVMINRHLDGSPLRYYAYTHFNSVSITGDKIILGAHGRKAHSGQFSGVHTISHDLDPASIRHIPTPYVHAHDMMIADGDFYACDSRNGVLIRNGDKFFVDHGGFMRGLSVLEDGYLVGQSVKSDVRADRNRQSASGNQITHVGRNGEVLAKANLFGSQVYNILVLSEPDLTVSSLAPADKSAVAPDIAERLARSASRDVVIYYEGETPPFHQRIGEY
jgi:hypothetical protein